MGAPLTRTEGAMRLLLHACCGPCLLEPLDALAAEHDVTVVYANPNIHPAEEYARRRDTLLAYARDAGIRVVELPYEPAAWERAVAGHEDDPAERCPRCYRLRLGMAAEAAAEGGYEAIATTLTVSPYQDQDEVRAAGERAADAAGVAYEHRDFRDRYPQATRRSRELGMYRQRYCGCAPSEAEAERDRARRRESRRAGA